MKKSILFTISLVLTMVMQAQNSRDFIKQHIQEENECNSVAITQSNGNAMIYGRNGWASEGCPKKFTEALRELNNENKKIQDIHLTEDGRWIILFENNGMQWDNIYEELLNKMIKYNEDGEEITTITCNDDGEWILITTKSISASSNELLEWLGEGLDLYGQLWTASVTNDAIIAVYENGFRLWGNIPEGLTIAIEECDCNIYTIKIAGDAWFFRCTDGYWHYYM